MIKACTQHDIARVRESCHPDWALLQSLEEGARPMMSHVTVTAELAVSQDFPNHLASRSPGWVREGWAWRGDVLTWWLGLPLPTGTSVNAESPAPGPRSTLAPEALLLD